MGAGRENGTPNRLLYTKLLNKRKSLKYLDRFLSTTRTVPYLGCKREDKREIHGALLTGC